MAVCVLSATVGTAGMQLSLETIDLRRNTVSAWFVLFFSLMILSLLSAVAYVFFHKQLGQYGRSKDRSGDVFKMLHMFHETFDGLKLKDGDDGAIADGIQMYLTPHEQSGLIDGLWLVLQEVMAVQCPIPHTKRLVFNSASPAVGSNIGVRAAEPAQLSTETADV